MNKLYFFGLCMLIIIVGVGMVEGANIQASYNITIDKASNSTINNILNINTTAINITLTNFTIPISDVYSNLSANYRFANIGNITIILQPNENITILDGGCDTIPVDEITIGATTTKTLCGGTYNLVDSGNNGIVRFTGQGGTLNCNATRIIGDNTNIGVDTNFNNNLNITGCLLTNYSWHVYVRGSTNVTVKSNSFTMYTGIGVKHDRDVNTAIINNIFQGVLNTSVTGTVGVAWDTNGTGIFGGASTGVLASGLFVENNTFNLLQRGVRMNMNTTGSNIRNNNFTNFGSAGYSILNEREDKGGHTIYNNNFILAGWDSIVIRSNNNVVRNNYLNEFWHHGIDTLDAVYNVPINNSIYNNNITDWFNDPSFYSAPQCIYINQFAHGSIYNNSCYNSGITIEGTNNVTWNISVYDNKIYDANSSALYIMSDNTTVYNNFIGNVYKFNGSNGYHVWTGSPYDNKNQLTRLTFRNNTYGQSNVYFYFVYNGTSIVNIDETTTSSMFVETSTSNAKINFTYTGNKNLTVTSPLASALTYTNISIFNQLLSYPYNDVYNVSTSSVLQYNVDNYSISLQSGQQIIIGDYVRLSTVSSVVSNNNVVVNFSIFTPMNASIGLSSDNLNATSHSFSLVGLSIDSLYNFNVTLCSYLGSAGCKSYTGYSFTTGHPASAVSDSRCAEARTGIVAAFSEFPLWFTIMFIVLAMSILIGGGMYMMNQANIDFDMNALWIAIIPILVASMFIILGIVILSSMC